MPYIKNEDRERALTAPQNAGELNYCLTMIALKYVQIKGECYQTYNDIFACMKCYDQAKYNWEDIESPANTLELKGKIGFTVLRYIGTQASKGRTMAMWDVEGVFECCKMELYRRMCSNYENLKATLNGDVFPKGEK